jgi:aspartyl-tRNA(Asn)/glutamyl-tRNA(Gln) amidotransferase subunit A
MLRRIRKETTKPLDDEIVSQIIRLPTDVIRDAHAQLLGFEAQDTHYSAGGSSCGGAASVAHGSSLLSLGSDTGGSIRLPAAWCGVVGLKPTYGKLSRHGLVAYASSTDTIGILAPSVDCVKQALEPLAQQVTGHDSNQTRPPMHDSLTVSSDDTDTSSASVEDSSSLLSGMKIGIPAAFSVSECPSAVRDAWSLGAHTLQRHGATVEEVTVDLVSPEVLQKSLAAYYVLVSAEASSNLARYDGFRYGTSIDPKAGHKDLEGSDFSLLEQQYACTRVEEFGKEVIRRVLCGTSVLSSDRFHTYYEAAAKLRSVLTRQLQQATAEYDLLLVPTVVFPPPEIGDEHKIDQTEQFANDVMTVPISLSGLPAVSVPVGEWDGHGRFLPGLQLVGSRHGEEALLRAAAVLEKASKR